MTSYAKDIGDRIKEDVLAPVAKGTAQGSEKIADGSAKLADVTRKVADKTREWADDVTGARNRRLITRSLITFGLAALVAYLIYYVRHNDK